MRQITQKTTVILVILAASLVMSSCGSTPTTPNYVDHYLQNLNSTNSGNIPKNNQYASKFVEFFANPFDVNTLEIHINELYAEDIYFSDTIVVLQKRSDLIKYFQQTAEDLQEVRVEILGKYHTDADVFVRWVMYYEFKLGGKTRKAKSIGMSHLRYNANGKIVLHQDYWDSAEGLYRHLPFSGSMINRVRHKTQNKIKDSEN